MPTESVVIPTQGSVGATGYNLSASNNYTIPSHGKGIVDTGFAVSLPPGTNA